MTTHNAPLDQLYITNRMALVSYFSETAAHINIAALSIDIHAHLHPTFHVPQLVYFHTFSVLQTGGWWQPQWFWGWYRDHLVSSYSAAAVSPCVPDQTGDTGPHRLNTVKLYITSCIKTTVLNLL